MNFYYSILKIATILKFLLAKFTFIKMNCSLVFAHSLLIWFERNSNYVQKIVQISQNNNLTNYYSCNIILHPYIMLYLYCRLIIFVPFYSLDARNGSLINAVHWAVSDDLGRRAYFQVGDGHRAKLKVTKVTLNDQGVFRCRVDFVDSPTRNFRVNLTLVGNYRVSKCDKRAMKTSVTPSCLTLSEQPSRPVIYDAQGREVTGVGGPFLEGYNLALICQVSGGKMRF